MKTITLTISTKKGESQTLRFLVVQEIPYPDIGDKRNVRAELDKLTLQVQEAVY